MSIVPGIKVIVDFTDTAETNNLFFDDSTLGLFDTGTFADTNAGVDIAGYVRSGQVTRGASRVDGVHVRYDAGKLSLVLENLDRRFDPTNLSGPYAAGGASQVTPMRKIRLLAQSAPVSSPAIYDYVFTGYVDQWELHYPANANDATVTVTATDGTKVLSAFDGAEQASQGAGETTHARLERIADRVGFPVSQDATAGRVASPINSDGQALTTCQATTLAANAWTEMLLTADTELGYLYFLPDGRLRFWGRHLPFEHPLQSAAITFGDQGSELRYTDIEIGSDDSQLFNSISIARTGGTAKTADSSASQEQYLTHSYSRTDLVHQTDAESQLYADYILKLCKDPALTIRAITMNVLYPDQEGVLTNAIRWDLTYPVTVKFTPPGGGSRISRNTFLAGIDHVFTPDSWTTRWTLLDATRYAAFVFDSTTSGVLDTNWFAY